jgi:hypothetical protein
LPAVDFSVFDFLEDDRADQNLAADREFAFAMSGDGALALIQPLLAQLQLIELALQSGNLVIEFGHGIDCRTAPRVQSTQGKPISTYTSMLSPAWQSII